MRILLINTVALPLTEVKLNYIETVFMFIFNIKLYFICNIFFYIFHHQKHEFCWCILYIYIYIYIYNIYIYIYIYIYIFIHKQHFFTFQLTVFYENFLRSRKIVVLPLVVGSFYKRQKRQYVEM